MADVVPGERRSKPPKNNEILVIAIVVILGFYIMIGVILVRLLWYDMNLKNDSMMTLGVILSAINASFTLVLGYYFGSNASGKVRDQTNAMIMSKMAGGQQQPANEEHSPLDDVAESMVAVAEKTGDTGEEKFKAAYAKTLAALEAKGLKYSVTEVRAAIENAVNRMNQRNTPQR